MTKKNHFLTSEQAPLTACRQRIPGQGCGTHPPNALLSGTTQKHDKPNAEILAVVGVARLLLWCGNNVVIANQKIMRSSGDARSFHRA
jgi:hypothetical protein